MLIATSVKYAKKGKRFERYGRFLNANKLLDSNHKKVENKELIVKLDKLKEKIEKGIIKYQIKE